MPWDFKPQQRTIKVVPGEPALACYTAYNPTKKPITGVATYNVTPQKCGVYFTKYQCFCFDEQRLRPREEIDMPVRGLFCVQNARCRLMWLCVTLPRPQLLFWVDPEILEDPLMGDVHHITLSYTFFKTDEEDEEEEEAEPKSNRISQEKIEEWKKETQELTGVDLANVAGVRQGDASEDD